MMLSQNFHFHFKAQGFELFSQGQIQIRSSMNSNNNKNQQSHYMQVCLFNGRSGKNSPVMAKKSPLQWQPPVDDTNPLF